ncbi:MAG: hypothetical protein C4316_07355 [Chloroflexota bacterium]
MPSLRPGGWLAHGLLATGEAEGELKEDRDSQGWLPRSALVSTGSGYCVEHRDRLTGFGLVEAALTAAGKRVSSACGRL